MMRLRTLKQEIHAAQVVRLFLDRDYCGATVGQVQVTKVEAPRIVDLAPKGRKPVASWDNPRTLVLIPRPRA